MAATVERSRDLAHARERALACLGFVDLADVKGRAFLIYWSWDGTDRWVRWERIGSLIY